MTRATLQTTATAGVCAGFVLLTLALALALLAALQGAALWWVLSPVAGLLSVAAFMLSEGAESAIRAMG